MKKVTLIKESLIPVMRQAAGARQSKAEERHTILRETLRPAGKKNTGSGSAALGHYKPVVSRPEPASFNLFVLIGKGLLAAVLLFGLAVVVLGLIPGSSLPHPGAPDALLVTRTDEAGPPAGATRAGATVTPGSENADPAPLKHNAALSDREAAALAPNIDKPLSQEFFGLTDKRSKTIPVFIADNGVHADFIFPVRIQFSIDGKDYTADWDNFFTRRLPSVASAYSKGFIVVGWGERKFYTSTPDSQKLGIGLAFKAALGGEAALHVDYISSGVFLKDPSIRIVNVTPSQYLALCRAVQDSAVRGTDGKPKPMAEKGFSASDIFYEAKGDFSLLNTCNTWTGKTLRRAGLPAPMWTPVSAFIGYHLKK